MLACVRIAFSLALETLNHLDVDTVKADGWIDPGSEFSTAGLMEE